MAIVNGVQRNVYMMLYDADNRSWRSRALHIDKLIPKVWEPHRLQLLSFNQPPS